MQGAEAIFTLYEFSRKLQNFWTSRVFFSENQLIGEKLNRFGAKIFSINLIFDGS